MAQKPMDPLNNEDLRKRRDVALNRAEIGAGRVGASARVGAGANRADIGANRTAPVRTNIMQRMVAEPGARPVEAPPLRTNRAADLAQSLGSPRVAQQIRQGLGRQAPTMDESVPFIGPQRVDIGSQYTGEDIDAQVNDIATSQPSAMRRNIQPNLKPNLAGQVTDENTEFTVRPLNVRPQVGASAGVGARAGVGADADTLGRQFARTGLTLARAIGFAPPSKLANENPPPSPAPPGTAPPSPAPGTARSSDSRGSGEEPFFVDKEGRGDVFYGPVFNSRTGKNEVDADGNEIQGYTGAGGPNGFTITRNGMQRSFDAGGFEGGSLTAEQEAKRAADASAQYMKNVAQYTVDPVTGQRRVGGGEGAASIADQVRVANLQRNLMNDQQRQQNFETQQETAQRREQREANAATLKRAQDNPDAFIAEAEAKVGRLSSKEKAAGYFESPEGAALRTLAKQRVQQAFQQGAGWWTNAANPEQAAEVGLGNLRFDDDGNVWARGPTIGSDGLVNAAGGGDVNLTSELRAAGLSPRLLREMVGYELEANQR